VAALFCGIGEDGRTWDAVHEGAVGLRGS
jgi:hypothetical protein